ncbi:ADP-ribose pyrophosphatase YjhB, NUDIX family [Amphritea atlantica]|jgi:8-oxo-dGTP pyrophosphatase MutT (NUDIX family)|uniref:Phosphatase NudJ n=1 Tax=Amphritea atlantica TaxID=355243 RepID=A0A1H9IQF2_9GAMM|nr:NUDIX hydrolase [Amphritea atlantica]SEQ77001.1 ADP-ribose pyrophosphatase YjhB, NUDIX family [Amphritea atlantica]
MRWTPHVTVATIIEQDNKFLCVEEQSLSLQQLVINQPAGHVEANETFIEAAIRETQEETGWSVTPTALIGIYVYTAPANGITYHRYCFAAQADSHDPDQPLDTGIERAIWLSREELEMHKERLRSPMVTRCIDDYLAGNRFPLSVIVEANQQ